ncbi:tRNA (adenosine(37)-N6)-threonylcarbamoyltransferase complex ATPase subunit type 1 TsaE [Pedobacter nutrimenti]|jgi:tRNA threonylcarbamoyladenosine biosynthesis protein TsaE|uniref:tRNA threonylcarbamoyladenosine biosynthesis protein TsaE n=1 Tax=Pedobacter nutrimenti TaxID=1241337 RepID=A0A318UH52_9SPHI|nr:tRNA (adenosine(37)-N6)-threonylcarbamoyltransferase complex ATPase subunit type 1 TsaE [Pedobacter nutrimenti]PYF75776.1 tRNA threonylcarbamoyladenosine biosynthesis protein TsaE [Pedobacter nutrimenti]
MNIEINGLPELKEAAQKLLTFASGEKIFLFEGEMGAGKTTFIKEICKALGVIDVVSSPTFSIVNEYHTDHQDIVYHFDFYRLKNLREAYDIGYEEYFFSDQFCLIEWPEKIEELIPEHYIKVSIRSTSAEKREITFVKITT